MRSVSVVTNFKTIQYVQEMHGICHIQSNACQIFLLYDTAVHAFNLNTIHAQKLQRVYKFCTKGYIESKKKQHFAYL